MSGVVKTLESVIYLVKKFDKNYQESKYVEVDNKLAELKRQLPEMLKKNSVKYVEYKERMKVKDVLVLLDENDDVLPESICVGSEWVWNSDYKNDKYEDGLSLNGRYERKYVFQLPQEHEPRINENNT